MVFEDPAKILKFLAKIKDPSAGSCAGCYKILQDPFRHEIPG